jgi:hypothetical protein
VVREFNRRLELAGVDVILQTRVTLRSALRIAGLAIGIGFAVWLAWVIVIGPGVFDLLHG